MNAIACAVPMICLPTGRDQLVNARRVEACDVGIALEPDATTQEIRAAVEAVLAGTTYRASVNKMAGALRQLCADEPAISELEALIRHTRA
jgi:UDP:flavonoid glycosyltransferase YjiC (YdhE family)